MMVYYYPIEKENASYLLSCINRSQEYALNKWGEKMKLNKHGWGFLEFFFFLIIFVICLYVAFEGLKKLGLMDENNQFINNGNTNNTTNKNDKEEHIISYPSLEEKLVEGAKKYIAEYYGNNLGLDTLNIRASQLKSSDYLDKLEDTKGRSCSGYVSIYVDVEGNTIYKPFLKCKDYTTSGYEERKDD